MWIQMECDKFEIKESFVKFNCVLNDEKLHGVYDEIEESLQIVK